MTRHQKSCLLYPVFRDSPVVEIPERLTVLEALVFKQTVGKLLQQGTSHDRIFLDFSRTRFIDSSGIGALIANFKLAQTKNIELILESVQPPVMATLSNDGTVRYSNYQIFCQMVGKRIS